MRDVLDQRFSPERLEIVDESAAHAGHPGAARGGGHYRVLIIASAFAGQARRERHQAVYDALAELMSSDIHALSIQALAPGEAIRR